MHNNKKALLFALLILGVASEALASDYDGNQGTVQLVSQTSAHGPQARARAEARGSYGSARAPRPSTNADTCPAYEGYPDCHPGSASGSARGFKDSQY